MLHLMKTILRKKWFRRLCQTLVALISLLVLAVMAINWRGARMKREIIAQLRAGLSRLHTASPLLHRVAAATEIEPACFGFPPCLLELASGLRFRAELALAAGRPEIALESLLIHLRLAALIRSDAYLMGQAFQNTLHRLDYRRAVHLSNHGYGLPALFRRSGRQGRWRQT